MPNLYDEVQDMLIQNICRINFAKKNLKKSKKLKMYRIIQRLLEYLDNTAVFDSYEMVPGLHKKYIETNKKNVVLHLFCSENTFISPENRLQ